MSISKTTQLIFLLLSLLILGVAPPFIGAFFIPGSYAPGISLSVIFIFICLFSFWTTLLKAHVKTFIFLFLFAFWSLAQIFFGGWVNERSIYSFLLFVFFLITVSLASVYYEVVSVDVVRGVISTLVKLGGMLAVINFLSSFELGYYLGYPYNKSIFPFGEPSHFALFFGSLWLAYSFIADRVSYVVWGAVYFLMAIFIPSVSLLAYVIILMVVSARFTFVRSLGLFLVFFCMLLWVLNDNYFLSRVNIFGGNNLSGLVYLQGIKDAAFSFYQTFGLGLGFQMLGTQPPSDVSLEIANILGTDEATNRFDGGFLAAKLVAEFGILGLALIFGYLRYALISFVWLRRLEGREIGQFKDILCHCVVLGFSVELFVRGIGYFSAGLFIFLVAVFYLGRRPACPAC
ncbi:hypothetical protein [Stutzerimonas xanthomarina]|uniref:hypothetical protein n=1 Tax=Stutzerimonas xanthomarina TaxID=271420 RepID=UPI000F79821B|nr:hypothetical protein [Stutzerimonas xanthomarina]